MPPVKLFGWMVLAQTDGGVARPIFDVADPAALK